MLNFTVRTINVCNTRELKGITGIYLTANEVKAQQNIDLYDNKNDNVCIVKPSYLINKWRHFVRVPTYHEWQTSKSTTPYICNT